MNYMTLLREADYLAQSLPSKPASIVKTLIAALIHEMKKESHLHKRIQKAESALKEGARMLQDFESRKIPAQLTYSLDRISNFVKEESK